MFTSAGAALVSRRSDRLSSSSMSKWPYGTTPMTGLPVKSSSCVRPGRRISTSPRNLLMMRPRIRACSSSSSSLTVPYSDANTPPRSMSPTSRTGASTNFARPIFTISSCLRLISAGLPAPSITIMSFSAARLSNASLIMGKSAFLWPQYSRAVRFPCASPMMMTCEPTSLVGLSKIGFMRTSGAMPAASACTTCARPISLPSAVMNELSAIFCDLNGATR